MSVLTVSGLSKTYATGFHALLALLEGRYAGGEGSR